MSAQQPGDQHQQPHYVGVPTDPIQHQQQQVSSVPAAATTSGSYPAFDLAKFWTEQMQLADMFESDFKNHPLPLARIKKVMKTDQEVKAPVLFAKGCEIFITELTKRAWVHAEENKRRTLQRSDIATAISKTDMCDFLIDIVPREEAVKAQSVPYGQQQQEQPPQQPEYGGYYPAQGGVPQYAPQQTMEAAAYASYSQLTAEQMQQYQIQLHQFAQQQQQQQQQQQHAYPHGAESSTPAQQSSTNNNPPAETE
ncbi:hypothetical protein [Parasitella parasitica]|uniref:Core Histone H2A/H2B/H3 domain-containing protein n=1 Tax=Parasitella parasitica TaxID=35722 RepID=A0A0B7NAY0_9FUNG|nr:hypothetical protein [Parasitella parasitica]